MNASGVLTVQRFRAGQAVAPGIPFTYDDSPVPVLTLATDWQPRKGTYRSVETYTVAEFATGRGWDGRAFRLTKPDGSAYDVFVTADPAAEADRCDCDGFTRWRRCKHADCLRHLVEVGVIPAGDREAVPCA